MSTGSDILNLSTTAQRTGLTSADSLVLATFASAYGAVSDCAERSTIVARLTFDTNARTASIRALFYDADGGLLGMSDTYTTNATTQQSDATPRYTSIEVDIPCQGYRFYRLQLVTISGGNAAMHHGTRI